MFEMNVLIPVPGWNPRECWQNGKTTAVLGRFEAIEAMEMEP